MSDGSTASRGVKDMTEEVTAEEEAIKSATSKMATDAEEKAQGLDDKCAHGFLLRGDEKGPHSTAAGVQDG